MSETIGTVHFLTAVTLWAVWLETRITPWPKWATPLAFLTLEIGIIILAGATAAAYT